MRLSGLVPLLSELPEFRQLLDAARSTAPEAAPPHVAVRYRQETQKVGRRCNVRPT